MRATYAQWNLTSLYSSGNGSSTIGTNTIKKDFQKGTIFLNTLTCAIVKALRKQIRLLWNHDNSLFTLILRTSNLIWCENLWDI